VPVDDPVGIRHGGGESANRALVWNVGTCHSDVKGEIQGKKTKYESTDAEYRDGATCSSDEGAVMALIGVEKATNLPSVNQAVAFTNQAVMFKLKKRKSHFAKQPLYAVPVKRS
jgi:hypothetical protein